MRIILFLTTLVFLADASSRTRYRDRDANTTAYLAFKIQDRKITARVQRLDEAALNVSLDFSRFIIPPDKLVQPLLTFQLEDDEIARTAEIYDRRLRLALCQDLPRRIPYTEFRVVNSSMVAMSQNDYWITNVKNALLQSLNRHGFIFLDNLDENMIVISDSRSSMHRVDEIDIRNLKLIASAYVDRLYICRGNPPSPSTSTPCVVAHEFPVIECDTYSLANTPLKDFIPLMH